MSRIFIFASLMNTPTPTAMNTSDASGKNSDPVSAPMIPPLLAFADSRPFAPVPPMIFSMLKQSPVVSFASEQIMSESNVCITMYWVMPDNPLATPRRVLAVWTPIELRAQLLRVLLAFNLASSVLECSL